MKTTMLSLWGSLHLKMAVARRCAGSVPKCLLKFTLGRGTIPLRGGVQSAMVEVLGAYSIFR